MPFGPKPFEPMQPTLEPAPPRSAACAAQSATRTLLKSLTWQALGLVTTTATAFALTGSLAVGGTMAITSAAIGTILYALHERAWERVDWGKDERR